MKTLITMRIHHLLSILFVLLCLKAASQISSTVSGGLWSATSTWIGGSVPGYNDDVIINGPVSVDGIMECNNMLIQQAGSIQNAFFDSFTLFVYGSIHVNGSINDNTYSLFLYVSGNVIQNGIWQNYQTFLNGDQTISMSQPIKSPYLNKQGGNLTALSGLSFENCIIDLGAYNLFYTNGNELTITGGSLSSGYISTLAGSTDTLTLTFSSAYLENVSFSAGTIQLIDQTQIRSAVSFHGTVINNGVLTNSATDTYSTTLEGNFINNGIVTDNIYDLYMYISGDITNNGSWSNHYTALNGSADQSLVFHQPFQGEFFEIQNSWKNIIALTDISFINSKIHFNNGILTFPQSRKLTISGGYLSNSNIQLPNSTADTLELDMSNDAYLNSYNVITAGMIKLTGTTHVHGYTEFFGNLLNTGTLSNYYDGTYSLTVNGGIANTGVIKDNLEQFHLYFTGDIVNDGTWENWLTQLTGSGDQHFTMTQPFNGHIFFCGKSSGNIVAMSDLAFNNCEIEINGYNLNFDHGEKLTVNGGYLRYAVIHLTSTVTDTLELHMSDAFLHSHTEINADFLKLSGTINVHGTTIFNAHVYNVGSLFNYFDNIMSLQVNGSVTNEGIIGNNGGNHLYLFITKNITNKGSWQNMHTYLIGEEDQAISLYQPFEGTNLENIKPSGTLTAMTDLQFNQCQINMNNGVWNFSQGNKLHLNGGYLYLANIESSGQPDNTFELFMENNSFLYSYNTISSPVVQLSGTVLIYGTAIFTGHILNSGLLMNHPDAMPSLVGVSGDLSNTGTIQNNGYEFYVEVSGNIINDNIWTNSYTSLTGTTEQSITLHQPFSGGYLYNNNSSYVINALSDLEFHQCHVFMNGSTLNFVHGNKLTVIDGFWSNSFINKTTPEPDTLELNFYNNAFLDTFNEISTDVLILNGFVSIHGNTTFNANVVNNGTLVNNGDGYYLLTINGGMNNKGVINNNNYTLTLFITGDIENHGTWANSETHLNGMLPKHMAMTQPFTGQYLYNTDGNSPIQATTALFFSGSNVDLNNASLTMPSFGTLSVLNGCLSNAVIEGNLSVLEMNDCAIVNSDIHNMTLRGNIFIGYNVNFYGNMKNEGTLQNWGVGSAWLTVEGNLANYGIIQNYYNHLYINIKGDVVNGGTWLNYWTQMEGILDQTITLVDNIPIEGPVYLSSGTGTYSFTWYYNTSDLTGHPSFNGANSPVLEFLVPVSQLWEGTFKCLTDQGYSRNIFVNTYIAPKLFDIKVNLQGSYSGTQMRTDLNSAGLIPQNQPYYTAPWNYYGSEWVASPPNPDVVDWVMVEVRMAPTAAQATSAAIVARRAGFILKNGHIVAVDGVSPLSATFIINDNLFIVVNHRNHLAVMSANSVTEYGGVFSYDFTMGSGQAFGTIQAHKEIAPGIWGMTAADGNSDGQINNTDKNDIWAPQAGNTGYLKGDFNMDSQVNNNDKNELWKPNTGLGSQVP